MRGWRKLASPMLLVSAFLAPALTAGIAAQSVTGPPQIDFVHVDKSARTMTLFSRGRIVLVLDHVQLGGAPAGPKRFEGDQRTPEGLYEIDWANPDSAYYLSLHISYPNASDRAYAESVGRKAGGMIMIHGQPNGLKTERMAGDWTDGCIAVSNAEMDILWDSVPDGTPIRIAA